MQPARSFLRRGVVDFIRLFVHNGEIFHVFRRIRLEAQSALKSILQINKYRLILCAQPLQYARMYSDGQGRYLQFHKESLFLRSAS